MILYIKMSYKNKRGSIGRNSGRPFNSLQPRRRLTNHFRPGRIQRRPHRRFQGHFQRSFSSFSLVEKKLNSTYLIDRIRTKNWFILLG